MVILSFSQSTFAEDKKQTKEWVYIQNDELRVGFLKSHGGALAYLSTSPTEFNVLNHYDHGRLVQQSYYGDSDGSQWASKPWRYNPVQGGNYTGTAAKLVEFKSTKNTVYAKTIPRHWASGQLLEECMMEQKAELNGPILRVDFKFTYNGSKLHKSRNQETPAVFVSPKLNTFVSYVGDKPWAGEPLSRKVPGWPNEKVALSENWGAYVGKDDTGIGVYVPTASTATSYRFIGGAGSDCSYFAPLKKFALTPGLSYSYSAYFTLGNIEAIRARFKKISLEIK